MISYKIRRILPSTYLICWNLTCTNVILKQRLTEKSLIISTYNQEYLKRVILVLYCIHFRYTNHQRNNNWYISWWQSCFQLMKILQLSLLVFKITSISLEIGYENEKSRPTNRSHHTLHSPYGQATAPQFISTMLKTVTNSSQIPRSSFWPKLTWKHHVKQKRKQPDLRFKEINWLIDRKSYLPIDNKRFLYKTALKPIWLSLIHI